MISGKLSSLAKLAVCLFSISTVAFFSLSDVQADTVDTSGPALSGSLSEQVDRQVDEDSEGNEIPATAKSQAGIGFEDKGVRIYAPSFNFGSVFAFSKGEQQLDARYDQETPNNLGRRSLVVNDYSEIDGWRVNVGIGLFRDVDDASKVLDVQAFTLRPKTTRLYYGTPQIPGTLDPQKVNWTGVYQYTDPDQYGHNSTIKLKDKDDPNSSALTNEGVPTSELPWQYEDPSSANDKADVVLTPFDDSGLSDGERKSDPYLQDTSSDADVQVAHKSLLDRWNNKSESSALQGAQFKSNFQEIWGADGQDDNGHYHGKGWWGLSFQEPDSATITLGDSVHETGHYQATIYWVLTSDPLA